MMRNTIPFQTAVLVVAFLFGPPAAAQAPGAIADQLNELADRARIPGMSLAYMENGEVAWTHVVGVRSAVTAPKVTPETVFEAASLSKPVVAWVVHRLAADGAFDLDRPLAEYLAYDRSGTDPRLFDITARTVLRHASGFPNWRPAGGDLAILTDPGLQFSYSGEGFVFLQQAVEKATSSNLHALAQQLVFRPLGMTSSSFVWRDTYTPVLAVGHDREGVALNKFTPEVANAAFSLHTTAADYARFMIALATGEGLPEDAVTALTQPSISAEDGIYWSEGVGLEPTPAGQALWHWGDNAGYKAFAWVAPGATSGFVLFTNSDNGMLILEEVYDLLIDGPGTAVAWLNYESVDDPVYILGRNLMDVLAADGLEAALSRYHDARGQMPPGAYVEDALNTLGYNLLRSGRVDEAIAFFELNTTEYPDSYNVFDSLGEAYYVKGDFETALTHYRKSVLMNPSNEGGKVMISTIQERLAGN
ncbi:MAG: serine hydrolase [Rhodothermales bacterium]